MNKEPLSIFIFRLLLNIGLFAFILMLYWSSLLVEQNMQSIQKELLQIKNEISTINRIPAFEKNDIESAPLNTNESKKASEDDVKTEIYPNLLTEDLFYKKTLPELLGPDFKPHGLRREATVGKPDHLHPFSNWSQIASWVGMCTVSIATTHFGKYETYAPEMALRMELRKDKEGRPEYWLHLRQGVYWQPLQQEHFSNNITLAPWFLKKHLVTAHDYKFFFDAVMNSHVDEGQAVALRTYYSDVEEVRVVDDNTFIIRWKTRELPDANGNLVQKMKYLSKEWTGSLRPLASFVYKYFPDGSKIITDDKDPNTYRTNPIWAQNFSQHWAKNIIVSCGPWIFDGLTDREIKFRRNPDYFFPLSVLTQNLEIKFKDSPDGIWEEFKSGSIDLFNIPPNQLAELSRFLDSEPYQKQKKQNMAIKRLDYIDRSYTYVGWNQVNKLFKSKKVRQALTMAIDRKRIIEQILNGMAMETTGTFFPYSPSYDKSIQPYPFDPYLAKQWLEEEGWYDSQGDGVIDKEIDGKKVPFRFKLTYFVKNATTKSVCEYIDTALKEIGIICDLNSVDMADLSAAFDDKSFDAIYLGWSLGAPPEDPKQIWYSAGANERGSSNSIGFSNAETDKIIDELQYEYDPQRRIELYHQFNRILYDEAPYTFLYTPKTALIYRDYLQNVFIPAERQDLIPGANVGEPQSSIFWIK